MSTYVFSDTSSTTFLVSNSQQYRKSGIGGAGNFRKTSNTLPIQSTARNIPTRTSGVFLTGIGGAGNRRSFVERAVITQEEKLARSAARRGSAATSWHHGIGGAGNWAYSSDASSYSSSASSRFSDPSTPISSGADRLKESIGSYFGASKLGRA